MTRRRALIGFTEAELGFVVAAVVAFTAAAEMPEKKERREGVGNADTTMVVGLARIDSVKGPGERPSVVTPDSIRGMPDSISRMFKRRCSEVKDRELARSPLGVIHVDGRDRYRIGNDQLSLQQLNRRLAPFEAEARDHKCRYTLRFQWRDSVPGTELLKAERPFSGRFYSEHP